MSYRRQARTLCRSFRADPSLGSRTPAHRMADRQRTEQHLGGNITATGPVAPRLTRTFATSSSQRHQSGIDTARIEVSTQLERCPAFLVVIPVLACLVVCPCFSGCLLFWLFAFLVVCFSGCHPRRGSASALVVACFPERNQSNLRLSTLATHFSTF
jgi:hypothetical protein